MLGGTLCPWPKQRSAGSPGGDVTSRLSTSGEDAVRSQAGSVPRVLRAHGHMGLPEKVPRLGAWPGRPGGRARPAASGGQVYGHLGLGGSPEPALKHASPQSHVGGESGLRGSARRGLCVNRQPSLSAVFHF